MALWARGVFQCARSASEVSTSRCWRSPLAHSVSLRLGEALLPGVRRPAIALDGQRVLEPCEPIARTLLGSGNGLLQPGVVGSPERITEGTRALKVVECSLSIGAAQRASPGCSRQAHSPASTVMLCDTPRQQPSAHLPH